MDLLKKMTCDFNQLYYIQLNCEQIMEIILLKSFIMIYLVLCQDNILKKTKLNMWYVNIEYIKET